MTEHSFIFNGTYTLVNDKGEHRTFKVSTQKDDARFCPGKRILSLMNGPDNTFNYDGFAFVEEDNSIRVWNRKHGLDKPTVYDYYACLFSEIGKHIEASESVDMEFNVEFCGNSYKVMMSKRCMRCNRKLTHPNSIRMGIGPECLGRMM